MSLDSKLALLKEAKEATQQTKAFQRLQTLFDEGTFVEIDSFVKSGDSYAEAVAGFGSVDGCPVYAFAQNSDIAGGAMSKAQAAKVRKVYDLAAKTGAPVVGLYDSVGARLKEGSDMLASYGDLLLASNNLSGVVPQISVVLGPCLGTSAMIAVSADIVIMSEKGQMAIATDGVDGTLASAQKTGLAHIAAKDEKEAIAAARKVVAMLPSNNLSNASISEFSDVVSTVEADDVYGILNAVVDSQSFVELQKEYGCAIVTGLAKLGGNTVGIVASQPNVDEGKIDADACSKAARMVRFCDAFAIPVLTFVNSVGFDSLREAVKLSNAYSEATTTKVTVITGSAYGPLYVAVAGRGANADVVMAWPDAAVSPLAPETAAMILWSDQLQGSHNPMEDRVQLIKKFKETEASPFVAAAGGYISDIIDPADTRAKLFAALDMLAGKRVSTLPKKHANIQI